MMITFSHSMMCGSLSRRRARGFCRCQCHAVSRWPTSWPTPSQPESRRRARARGRRRPRIGKSRNPNRRRRARPRKQNSVAGRKKKCFCAAFSNSPTLGSCAPRDRAANAQGARSPLPLQKNDRKVRRSLPAFLGLLARPANDATGGEGEEGRGAGAWRGSRRRRAEALRPWSVVGRRERNPRRLHPLQKRRSVSPSRSARRRRPRRWGATA